MTVACTFFSPSLTYDDDLGASILASYIASEGCARTSWVCESWRTAVHAVNSSSLQAGDWLLAVVASAGGER